MTKHDNPQGQAPPGESAHKFPHALDPTTEEEILRRVRPRVLEGYVDPSPRSFWPWALASSAVAACALLLWWGIPHQRAPHYQYKGLQVVSHAKTNATRWLHTKHGAQGRIVAAKRWSLVAQGNTRIGVRRGQKRRQEIDLLRGFVNIHVHPHTMKRFALHAQGFRVEVKGTKFTVERRKGWLQVEVWRGKVVLHTPKGTQTPVNSRRGCRVNIAQHKLRCYPLPPDTHRTPRKRIQWLGRHHPSQLLAYAVALASNPRVSANKRASLLREVTDVLHKARRWRAAIESYKLLAQQKAADSNQALLDAALLCRKTLSHTPQLCQSIFLQCLRQCRDKLWREQSLGLLAVSRFQQAKSKGLKARAIHTIHRYLRTYPKGSWQTNLRRLLVRHAIQRGQSCQRARKLLAPQDRGEAWFIKRCP